jgi:short-subunit dehydrogenase
MNKANLGVALVTGASSGIGNATAKALQNAGFRVFGTSRRAASERPDGVTMLTCDVTDDVSVAKLVDDVLAQVGRIDLLVNNAGMGLLGGAEESSMVQARSLFDVNVFGVFRVTNAVLPTMRHQGKGRIVNLSSVQGFIPAPYFALYSSTKHAVEGYSESLDHELRPFGIRVVLVEPAYTRTSFEDNLAKPDQLLNIYDSARVGGCDRSRSEEALCGGKNGAAGQFPAPFRPRIRVRQEPAKAARTAGLRSTDHKEQI